MDGDAVTNLIDTVPVQPDALQERSCNGGGAAAAVLLILPRRHFLTVCNVVQKPGDHRRRDIKALYSAIPLAMLATR